MKLYDCRVAPNPRRARMFLAEKGIALDTVEVDILGGENLQAAFLAINPRGLLPVLELDDGSSLYDSPVVCDAARLVGWRPGIGASVQFCRWPSWIW